jgi:hypothetical protein
MTERSALKHTGIGLLTSVLLSVSGAGCAGTHSTLIGMLRYDTRHEGHLHVGDRAPDVDLLKPDGSPVKFLDGLGTKPVVLILGSFT